MTDVLPVIGDDDDIEKCLELATQKQGFNCTFNELTTSQYKISCQPARVRIKSNRLCIVLKILDPKKKASNANKNGDQKVKS